MIHDYPSPGKIYNIRITIELQIAGITVPLPSWSSSPQPPHDIIIRRRCNQEHFHVLRELQL